MNASGSNEAGSHRGRNNLQGPPELSVVMPVYNEAGRLRETVGAWVEVFRRQGIAFRFLVYDDGSTDGSGDLLETCARRWREIELTRHQNRGHGPTIRRGYEEATGEWVFQTDSDLEVPPEQFGLLWNIRADFDLLVGCRSARDLGFVRNALSAVSRSLVRRLFAPGAHDVNSPFRLIRRGFLAGCLNRIPLETFAPNLLVTGFALADGRRYREIEVAWRPRSHGTGLRLTPATLLKLLTAARQTFQSARRPSTCCKVRHREPSSRRHKR